MAVQPLSPEERAKWVARFDQEAAATGKSVGEVMQAYAAANGLSFDDVDTYMGYTPGTSIKWAAQNTLSEGNAAASAPTGIAAAAQNNVTYGPEGNNQNTGVSEATRAGMYDDWRLPAADGTTATSSGDAPAGGVKPLSAEERAQWVAKFDAQAAAEGKPVGRVMQEYAAANGLSNADVDTYMGYAPGTAAQWVAQNPTTGGVTTPTGEATTPTGEATTPAGGTGIAAIPTENNLPVGTTVASSGPGAVVQPYVSDLLARGQALTGDNPYVQYTGERVAGPSELQQEVTGALSGLDTKDYLTRGASTLSAGANYTPGTEKFGLEAAQQYMNPYQQQVTDIAKREATRDAGIASTGLDSKLASAGAFGGSRHAIMAAEADRNLQQNLGDIQSKGLNESFQQAMGQFNADSTRNQQDRQYGSQAAIKGGGDMIDASGKVIGLQATQGLTDQNTQQRANDAAYQDFLNQQQHPYDQLTFMKNLTSGIPGSTSVTQTGAPHPGAEAPSNWASDASNWLTAGKGIWDAISGLFAQGGAVQSGGLAAPTQSGLGYGRVAQLYESLK